MGEFKKRVLGPLALPMAAFAFIGIMTLAFSRVLLAVPEAGSTTLALLIAAVILGVAGVLAAAGSRLKKSQKVLSLAAGIALLGAGVAGASLGVRALPHHSEEVEIVASSVLFETDTLELPADTAVDLVFINNDAGVPHNVEIYPDDTFSGEGIFVGEVFNGVATRTYELEPIPAGEYAFRCVVHPTTMVGTVIVGGEGGGHGEPAAPAEDHGAPADTPDDDHGDEPVADDPAPQFDAEEFETSFTIAAENVAFDTDQILLAAGVPTTIVFDNRDGGIPHNVEIYADDSFTGDPVFKGDIFNGEEERTYELPAIDAGDYAFRCVVHPTTMVGTAIFG